MSSVGRPDNDTCLVRVAKPFDHEAVVAMLAGTGADQFADLDDLSGLRDSLTNNTVLLAAYDTGLIGCIMASPGPQVVIHNLVVTPAHRNRGHASDLIGAAVELLQQDDRVRSFWTAIDPRLKGGIRRFERHGFAEVAETTRRDMRLMTRPAMASSHLQLPTKRLDPSFLVGGRATRQAYEAGLIR